MRRLISYKDLTDASVDLADLYILNTSITIEDENERRVRETLKAQHHD